MNTVEETIIAGLALAPFSREQIESLNAYQAAGVMHPFTCGADSRHLLLVAEPAGWVCLDCDYTQDWAHAWMADNRWRAALDWWARR